ncbi:unnamed protein product [Gadus morhua 'NCC']
MLSARLAPAPPRWGPLIPPPALSDIQQPLTEPQDPRAALWRLTALRVPSPPTSRSPVTTQAGPAPTSTTTSTGSNAAPNSRCFISQPPLGGEMSGGSGEQS